LALFLAILSRSSTVQTTTNSVMGLESFWYYWKF
jgi:hypothetical protein